MATTGPYVKGYNKFKRTAAWLTSEDELMLIHLKYLAITLDKQLEADGVVQPTMSNTFKQVLVVLCENRPKKGAEEDIDEDLGF